MTTDNSPSGTRVRPLYRRPWVIVSLSLILLFVAILVLLPVGMGYGLKKWLLDNGADRVTLQDIDFNPFSGRLAINGLQVSRGGRPTLVLPSLSLEMDWGPLWNSRAQIRRLRVNGLKLDILNSPRGMQVGGISLPAEASQASEEPARGEPWGIALEHLLLTESQLTYRDSKLETATRINRLTLRQLVSWLPQQPALLAFDGAVAEATARLDGKLLAFAAEPGFAGRLVLDDLALEKFARLAEEQVEQLRGQFSIASTIEVKQQRSGDIALQQEGRLSIRDLQGSATVADFDIQRAAWDGRAQLTLAGAGQSVELDLDGLIEQDPGNMKVHDAGLSLQHKGLVWQGALNLVLDAKATRLGASGELRNKGLALSLTAAQGPLNLQHQGLSWRGEMAVDLKPQASSLEASGALQNTALSLTLPDAETKLSNGALQWSGKFKLQDDAETTQLESDGQLKLEASRVDSGSDFVGLEGAELSSERLQFKQQKAQGGIELRHTGGLSLDKLSAQTQGDLLSKEQIQWQGDLSFSSAGERLQIESQGDLNGKGLRIALPRRDLLLQQGALAWQGKLGYGQEGQQPALSADGAVTLDDLLLEAPEHKSSLLSFEQMRIDGVAIENLGALRIAEVSTSNLLLSRRGADVQANDTELPALLATARSRLSNIRFDQSHGVSVDLLEHENLQTVIRRFADGKVNVIGVIDLLVELMAGEQPAADDDSDDTAAAAAVQNAKPEATGDALPVRVAKVALVGDSKLIFIDENVSPSYRAGMLFKQFEVTDIDSGDPQKYSPVLLKVAIGEDAELDVAGKVRFLDQQVTADLNGRIDGLALPPLSPYIAPALGYRISSGSLDADIAMKIDQGKLDGDNHLFIHGLEVEELSPEEKKQYQVQTTVPLRSGLAMLRSDDGNIDLKLPISGDISNPEFGLADAINTAMAKAMQQGARVYLAAALFPFGTMVAVAEIAGKSALEVRLGPVVFAPGSSELDDTALAYLEKLAKVLKERPAVRMKVCGVAVAADREALLEKAAAELKITASSAAQSRLAESGKDQGEADQPRPAAAAADSQVSPSGAGQGETLPADEKALRPADIASPPEISNQQLKALAAQRAESVKRRLRQEHGIKAGRLVACDAVLGKATEQAGPRVDLSL